ncbi:hypothetical protein [Methylocystis parvus]|uniref:Uncharacterized protein n=1 Tax=Methylocystis parvus TaxID=134 RepID=A0A6B8ME53_9HYPH|nr:hypothetical protein [Methylocystis parvus]QGM98910.1 hypothetical protein F7D14_16410 [Methylocystis parvus]WBK00734.1 hypothetical protein MMG94_03125 [Methylocystis parvus OBBP]
MRISAGASIVTAVVLLANGAASDVSAAQREYDPPAEYRYLPYSGAIPSCADPGVLREITDTFAWREVQYWNSGLAIVNYESVAETGYRTNGATYIPRRFCQAEAMFDDGRRRRVVYNVGEALGFIGLGSGVTWCVVGLDRNHAFSPNCRAAGP